MVKTRIADYLTFGEYAPKPTDASERLFKACKEARRFVENISGDVGDHLILEGEERFLDLQRHTVGEPTPEVWLDLYRAGFWFICAPALRRTSKRANVHRQAAHFGTHAQHALTRALLGVTTKSRMWIWNQFTNTTAMNSRWRSDVAGAVAVARAATCLHAMGKRVALPMVDLDFVYKIDLMVELSEDPVRLLCIQVKYSKQDCPSVEILNKERGYGDPPLTREQEQMVCGLLRLDRHFSVDWIPVFAEVHREGLAISQFEPLPRLREAFLRLLQQLPEHQTAT